jgi:peptidoglycan/LPS O-acetylase OafA/YrhL
VKTKKSFANATRNDRGTNADRFVIKPASTSDRIPQLDGLRGIAILLVISLHYLNDASHGPFGSILYRFGSIFRLGWTGVDLFFVLSGFLIGGILLDGRGAQNYFRTFYIRRFYRILPIYYLWVTLFVIAALCSGDSVAGVIPNDLSTLKMLPLYYLFLQNYHSLPIGTLAWFWLAVAWSLGIEEQFYLVSPPLVRFLSIRKLKRVLVATLILAPLLRVVLFLLWSGGKYAMYVWMPCRADSLAMGMLAALLWREGKIQSWYTSHRTNFYVLLGVSAALVPFLIKWLFSPYAFWMGFLGYSWLALLFAGLLVLSLLEPCGSWSRFLRWSPLREIGRVSYCVYLIHLLVVGLSYALLLHSRPTIASLRGALVALFAFGLTYLLAFLSWRFFEHPLLHLGQFHRYKFSEPDA